MRRCICEKGSTCSSHAIFLQAEAGIRGLYVTGVQTCALPISRGVIVVIEAEHLCMTMRGVRKAGARTITSAVRGIMHNARSEERRVGKDGRSRRLPLHERQNLLIPGQQLTVEHDFGTGPRRRT